MPGPFAHSVADTLVCVDSLDRFDPSSLDGFADGVVEVLRHSKHAARLGRLDFIREGLEENVRAVI